MIFFFFSFFVVVVGLYNSMVSFLSLFIGGIRVSSYIFSFESFLVICFFFFLLQ